MRRCTSGTRCGCQSAVITRTQTTHWRHSYLQCKTWNTIQGKITGFGLLTPRPPKEVHFARSSARCLAALMSAPSSHIPPPLSLSFFSESLSNPSSASCFVVTCPCFSSRSTSSSRSSSSSVSFPSVLVFDDLDADSVDFFVQRVRCPSSLPSVCVVGNGNVVWLDVGHGDDADDDATAKRVQIAKDVVLRSTVNSVLLDKTLADDRGWENDRHWLSLNITKASSDSSSSTSSSSSSSSSSRAPFPSSPTCLRLFIGGDKSHVGKSSVTLGLLSTLLSYLSPQEIAYVKPATQCEGLQLVTVFCESVGIECVPVGPIVYYAGFTRAFLAKELGQGGGPTDTQTLLADCSSLCDRLAATTTHRRKVLVVDGVGHVAVGSITGTCNATVASACKCDGAIIVCPPGVGAAVDSFNLSREYFEGKKDDRGDARVPVVGAVFNRLPNNGYYSLAACKSAVSSYFEQFEKGRSEAFGFIPEVPALADLRETAVTDPSLLSKALPAVEQFGKLFEEHVDVLAIFQALADRKILKQQQGGGQGKVVATTATATTTATTTTPGEALRGLSSASVAAAAADAGGGGRAGKTRKEIEAEAMRKGAEGSS